MENIVLPLLCTRGALVFPGNELGIEIGREQSVITVEHALNINSQIIVASQIDVTVDNPKKEDLYDVATICTIKNYRRRKDHLRVIFVGERRCRITGIDERDGLIYAQIELINDYVEDQLELEVLTGKAVVEYNNLIARYFTTGHRFGPYSSPEESALLVNSYAHNFLKDTNLKVQFLTEASLTKRLEMMLQNIYQERQMDALENEINQKVKEQIEDGQKDYYLRQKLKAIKDELNEGGGYGDIDNLKAKLESEPYPEHVKKKALDEIAHYEMLPAATGESGVIRSYLDWLLSVPWYQKSVDNADLSLAQDILDEDHYGLVKVKERILEYLAVKQMTNSLKSPIICLVGPPGVGKTSLAKSVARALDRKFVKVSLGGVKDEAEIRGHRRTYLGSMPGRIIQGMKRAGTLNPVFLIDEIDKMSSDYKGDPSSAMLEVLDPEQNGQFSDHYLEEPYDLSDVLFIATANYAENIPAALYDRLEIINLSSYTEEEKLNIAKEHLIPKQIQINGLNDKQMIIEDDKLLYLIRHYTREAGVRQLERQIGTLSRKTVLEILKNGKKSIKVNKKLINSWLGHEIYDYGLKEKSDQVGVVTGLAYTSFGGDILPIEVNYFEGKGNLIVTGNLGDVMVESTKIALDYIKANAKKYKVEVKFFDKHDIHIHCPEGAVPKDGPSAGIAITTAILSAITGRKVRSNLAMTGEVTLRGNVLPIGGLKEKSLAANRSGINKIIIPKGNLKDLDEVAETVKKAVEFVPVENVEQVIKEALR